MEVTTGDIHGQASPPFPVNRRISWPLATAKVVNLPLYPLRRCRRGKPTDGGYF